MSSVGAVSGAGAQVVQMAQAQNQVNSETSKVIQSVTQSNQQATQTVVDSAVQSTQSSAALMGKIVDTMA